MSLHPSLKIDKAGVQQRTVQTRIERIKELLRRRPFWRLGAIHSSRHHISG